MQIINQIKQDILSVNGEQIGNFDLIRAKKGVHVYKCTYKDTPAVVKYFENDDDKREISNYRMLNKHNIPTINVFAYGKSSVIMEDISVSEEWRLGIAEDLQDTEVTASLARWYFNFHEKGLTVPELKTLYCEYDDITEENINMLCEKLSEGVNTFRYILSRFDKLRKLIDMPSYTLTYNDFYWTNFVVRKDKQAAMMFDYNLLGKGYRYSDTRNVCWFMSDEARKAYVDTYNCLYIKKYGIDRTEEDLMEKQIDDVVSCLFTLIVMENPEEEKQTVSDGTLFNQAKELLG